MESLKKQNTRKIMYGRQRSLSDAEGLDIRLKNPDKMTE